MEKLSQYARNRIISLHKASNSIVQTVKILEKDGIKTSRNSVSSSQPAAICHNKLNNSYMLIF